MKRMTRRQAKHWLIPIRNAMAEIRTGYVDTIQGYAVTKLHENDKPERLDWCINGFVSLITRLMPDMDTDCAKRISNRIAVGTPLTICEVDTVLTMLNKVERRLVGLPIAEVKDAVTAEQICIELDALGLRKAA